MTKEAQIEALQSENTRLNELLKSALARISELEARQEASERAKPAKTSSNSSKPPSTDLGRKNRSLRAKSGKPVGGQRGHKGHTLKMSEVPDKIEPLYPSSCDKCGSSLADSPFTLVERRQVRDIPLIVPTTTEYRCFGTDCTCGHHQVAAFPAGVTNHIQYGPNIQSLAVYQSYYQFLPFARLQDFFQKVCGLSIGKGTLENIIRRTAKKAQPLYAQLHQAIVVSFFVGSDETGFKSNKARCWFWVWQTKLVTYLVAACSRSKQVIAEVFPDGLPNSILCTDRLAAQLSTVTKGKQICLAHLLRELNYLIEAEKHRWATQFKALLIDAIQLKQQQGEYPKNDQKALDIEQRADKLLDTATWEALLNDQLAYHDTITLFHGMIKLRHALFVFLYHEAVTFDNNRSERAFRMVKVKTKISGQFKSLQKEFAMIRSVIDTAVKNGRSPFEAINALVNTPMSEKAAA